MVWNQELHDDEWMFLSNLHEDIEEEVQVGLWRKKKSFIVSSSEGVLIYHGNPRQRTSWPMVGYVDLSANEHVLEYRLPLFMFLLTLYLIVYGLIEKIYIFSLFILVVFAIALFIEYVGVRDFLGRRMDLFHARQVENRRETS